VEAHEVGDTIAESTHNGHAAARSDDRFRRGAAVFLGLLGMLLAIASLGGENAMKETVNANILASDTYGFYQARNERQTGFQLAADTLDALLAASPTLTPAQRAPIEKRIADYRATIKHFESEPVNGTGKQELLAKARRFEAQRDEAQRRDLSFDYSRALFQIAIVLGSVSIVGASRGLLWLCAAIAVLAALLGANGFLLLVELPFS
jgi:uncharacterized protein DUF4337